MTAVPGFGFVSASGSFGKNHLAILHPYEARLPNFAFVLSISETYDGKRYRGTKTLGGAYETTGFSGESLLD